MVINEECGSCAFYMASPKVCRRFPPVPLMIGVRQGIAQLAQPEPIIQAFFPNMMATGWCGEYQQVRSQEKDN